MEVIYVYVFCGPMWVITFWTGALWSSIRAVFTAAPCYLAPVLLRRRTQIGERSPFQGDVSGFDARRRYYERGTMMYDRLAIRSQWSYIK